ncbi:flavin reductase family protein [Azospirillum rugosum]|uniref:Flavin reductase (DIM6/NTAB) family NADH-FMN oxidoreductase RutF n=1 Tax=Azospirillum rugosum TaxID=416170 RepID=A0ABS4SJS0_9PROT|nr:flavin reductase family protein [Azospirillum rugosum]MBP2292752.1 flavin reductase (DIM6/NTAB) family NADH-FMN oxidoreductase RutF [Azospirillum rugosum]MDQ0527011.1 flavin reductase (DIM6/NTAB) family NADH-FMN oxidoreductase RutF [Azospirillum rugosum]
MTEPALDPRDFRRALSHFPTGVTVVTTRDAAGAPVGVTASSFNAVSLNPPLVLWSLDKAALSAEAFRTAEHFAVNVLTEDQILLSNRFASRGEDKFGGIDWAEGLGGCPVFDGVSARFECRTWNVYDGGDHLIIVGQVMRYDYQTALAPLVFAKGCYAVSARHPATVG